jgi:hypothetical protein
MHDTYYKVINNRIGKQVARTYINRSRYCYIFGCTFITDTNWTTISTDRTFVVSLVFTLTGTITDITLWKNSTSGWNRIVKIWLKIENGLVVNEITWTNTNIRNRATIINQKVSPSSQAGLQIEISPMNVKFSDKGDYKCSIRC